MVRTSELSGPSILDALSRGDFYSTTGVLLADVRPMSDGLCLRIAEYESYGFRIEFIGPGGEVLQVAESEESCYRSESPPAYIRARVQRSDGARAWVQPVIFAGEV
jgi:hypothetical protein